MCRKTNIRFRLIIEAFLMLKENMRSDNCEVAAESPCLGPTVIVQAENDISTDQPILLESSTVTNPFSNCKRSADSALVMSPARKVTRTDPLPISSWNRNSIPAFRVRQVPGENTSFCVTGRSIAKIEDDPDQAEMVVFPLTEHSDDEIEEIYDPGDTILGVNTQRNLRLIKVLRNNRNNHLFSFGEGEAEAQYTCHNIQFSKRHNCYVGYLRCENRENGIRGRCTATAILRFRDPDLISIKNNRIAFSHHPKGILIIIFT